MRWEIRIEAPEQLLKGGHLQGNEAGIPPLPPPPSPHTPPRSADLDSEPYPPLPGESRNLGFGAKSWKPISRANLVWQISGSQVLTLHTGVLTSAGRA